MACNCTNTKTKGKELEVRFTEAKSEDEHKD
jgi:hypothetical protein